MMSMSGGWFFVVASEAITVGDTTVKLPGIGSWLAQAIAQENFGAVAWAVFAMAVVIVLYDQLVFRPVVAWADKFRFEQTASHERPRSWVYNLVRRTKLLPSIFAFMALPARAFAVLDWSSATPRPKAKRSARAERIADRIWKGVAIAACLGACLLVGRFIALSLSVADVVAALGLGLATLARVAVLIVIASLIWVPIGVWIGLRPVWSERLQPIAQFLAAFPANVLFPFAVIAIISLNLNPNIWLSPLIILGTQWYILFNVIAGASALPNDLKETARIFGMRGWQRWHYLRAHPRQNQAFVGAQIEADIARDLTVMAEAFTRDEGRPGAQVGLRWNPNRGNVDVDLLSGWRTDGVTPWTITLGVTIRR